jgi:hypothetical protein
VGFRQCGFFAVRFPVPAVVFMPPIYPFSHLPFFPPVPASLRSFVPREGFHVHKCFCKNATYVNFAPSKADQKQSKSDQKRSKTAKNSKKRHDFALPILTPRRATPSGAIANAVFNPPRGPKHVFLARKLT